jgi:hypothetical protein
MMVQILPKDSLQWNRRVDGPINSQRWGRIVAHIKTEMFLFRTRKGLAAELIHRAFSRDLRAQ